MQDTVKSAFFSSMSKCSQVTPRLSASLHSLRWSCTYVLRVGQLAARGLSVSARRLAGPHLRHTRANTQPGDAATSYDCRAPCKLFRGSHT